MRFKDFITEQSINEVGPAERVTTVGGTTVRANSRTGKISANTKIGNTNISVDNTLNKDGSSGKMSAATKIGDTTATYNTNKSGQQSLNVTSNLGNNKKASATSTMSKPGTKPVTQMRLKELKSKVEYDPKNRMDDITAQRIAKFGDMIDSDRERNPDAASISLGDTNKLIAQARAQLKHDRISDTKAHAHRKDGVHKQGFKPVKFPPVRWDPDARTKVDYLDGGRKDVGEIKEMEVMEQDEYGIVRYPDTSISYVKKVGDNWMHIYDASYGYEGSLDKEDMKYLSVIDADQVPSRLRESDPEVIGVDPNELDDEELEQFRALMQRAAKLDNLERGKSGRDINEEITLEDNQDFHEEFGMLGYAEEEGVFEAEYQGRKVKLNKPMRGDVKKFKVYVKNAKGNVVKVNFGDPNMRIKKSNPKRRKSFRARHNCDNPGPKWKARYWSCRKW